jgi:NitT/TauT family transport system substrate-binding protein
MKKILSTLGLTLALAFTVHAQDNPQTFNVGWSIYPGWQDNAMMQTRLEPGKPSFLEQRCKEAGGAKVEVHKFKEYTASIDALVAGKLDAVTLTLSDAMGIPLDSGVPVTCILINDYSNGNDAIAAPKGMVFNDLKGKSILCEQYSCSQYLVWRALQIKGMKTDFISFRNTPGDECAKVFLTAAGTANPVTVATWNPHILRIKASGKADILFSSKEIPGEIVDMVVVRTDRIKGREKAIAAYVKAHYDVMKYLTDAKTHDRAVRAMASSSEMMPADAPLFSDMLNSTFFYYTPETTIKFMESPELKTQHDRIRGFLKDVGAFKGANPDSYVITFDTQYVKQVK